MNPLDLSNANPRIIPMLQGLLWREREPENSVVWHGVRIRDIFHGRDSDITARNDIDAWIVR